MTPGEPGILHVDMDAFYAAVEVLEEPSLSGRPVIVGGSGYRGVVASCSYEARARGVHSAMPSVRARRLCPEAVFVPGRYELYAEYSRRLHAVLESFSPMVEGIGLDEAFLDVRSARRLHGTGREIAARIRAQVHGELGLWVSVGVATSKLVAKLASEAAKPTPSPSGPVPGLGVFVVEPGQELVFLHPLPVQRLWGVGPATRRRLDRFGVVTVGDLAALPLDTLVRALGQSLGRHLHELAWARDSRPVEPDREPKSVGHEETYAVDHHDREPLHREVLRLSDAVATRLRAQALAGRTVTLKVRFADFRTITRSRTERAPVDTPSTVAAVALDLLAQVDPTPGVRLLGVSASGLVKVSGQQMELDAGPSSERGPERPGQSGGRGPERPGQSGGRGPERPGQSGGRGEDRAVARAVDEVRRRFGNQAVGPAALVGKDGLKVKRKGDQQWGPSR